MSKMIRNPYTISPPELQPGVVLIRQVVLHVVDHGTGPCYQVYICSHKAQESNGIPQGARVHIASIEKTIAEYIFPVIIGSDLEPYL